MVPGLTKGLKASSFQGGFSSALRRVLVYLSLSILYFTEVFFTTPQRPSVRHLQPHYDLTVSACEILYTSKEVALQAVWKQKTKICFYFWLNVSIYKHIVSVGFVCSFSYLLNLTPSFRFYCKSLELTKRYMAMCRFDPGPKDRTFIQ